MIYKMDLGQKYGMMDQNLKEIIKKVKNMVKVCINGQMDQNMRVILLKIICMVKVLFNIQMENHIKVNIKII